MMFDTTSSSMPHIKSGKLKPLAVMSAKRSEQLPDIPTLAEAGVPGVTMTTWYGLYATGGTPRAVVERLHAELERALAIPEVQAKLKGLGGEIGNLGVDEFGEFNRAFVDVVQQSFKAGRTPEQAFAELKLPERFKEYQVARGQANVTTIYAELKK